MTQAHIERLLPDVFQRANAPGSPLAAIIDAMDAMLSPAEEAIASLPDNLNTDRASDPFVILLAYFMDLDRYLPQETYFDYDPAEALPPIASGMGRLRELIRAVPELSRWRGTGHGLCLFLETATGIPGFEVLENGADEHGRPRSFHVKVIAPANAVSYRDLVGQIVEQEKPAFVTHEIVFAQDVAD